MPESDELYLPEDRFFGPDGRQKAAAQYLYNTITRLPLICPHGHVDPRLFVTPDVSLGNPAELFIIPDHYVFRMLYSQGVPLESLGIPARPGSGVEVEQDPRKIWQVFAEHYYLFRGTPTGLWLNYELRLLFDVRKKLNGNTAQAIYDQVAEKLASPEFSPRRLFERFQIEALATTDAAHEPLTAHQEIRDSGWKGRVIPTFRPDGVVNLDAPGWLENVKSLEQVSGIGTGDYHGFIQALEERRAAFRALGATASDHAVQEPVTAWLNAGEANEIYQRALRGEADEVDAHRFSAHMLIEMARMSVEDGLVMQLHPGSLRDYNRQVFERFGRDKGADIPVATEFTRGLRPLLDEFGNDPRFRLVLFTLDETTYSRELAPLAGHYPSVRLGPPWWFFDSLNGMQRYFDGVMETAGLYNTVGFNDDTRAFASIPARHDLWRRASANWLAGLVVRGIVDLDDAESMAAEMAYGLAKKGYRL